MSTTQSPTIQGFQTLHEMVQSAMTQSAQDTLPAVALLMQWFEEDDALVAQFGKQLWRDGFLYRCTLITKTARHNSTQFVTQPSPVAPPMASSPVSNSPAALAPRVPALQRPTGEVHLGGASVTTDMEKLMNFPLLNGLTLWRATKSDILAYVASTEKQLGTMRLRNTWLLSVADGMVDGPLTVPDVFDKHEVKKLYLQAKQHLGL